MNKKQIIAELELKYPTLKKSVDGETIDLDTKEYEATILSWADAELKKLNDIAEAEAKATQRQAILDRLGLSADEAKLLLG
jgi:hypothetical protein